MANNSARSSGRGENEREIARRLVVKQRNQLRGSLTLASCFGYHNFGMIWCAIVMVGKPFSGAHQQ